MAMKLFSVLGVVVIAFSVVGCESDATSSNASATSKPIAVVSIASAPSSGPPPGPRGPHRFGLINGQFSYQCVAGGSFRFQFQDPDEEELVFADGANGLGFNLRRLPSAAGRVYGDGTLQVELAENLAVVDVGGSRYYSDCELWSHSYICSNGTFWLDTRVPDKSETVFWDGTNGKFFTLKLVPSSGETRYTDGVIVVDLMAATVVVGGVLYFSDCGNADPSF
jgi:hypothetical protein